MQSALRERIPALLDLWTHAHRDKRLQEFSKGMLQRIALPSMLNDPELIFSTNHLGLDPWPSHGSRIN